MSQNVGSLYVEIGAKTEGLKQGLSEAKVGMQGLAGQFESFTGVSIGAAAAVTALGAVLKTSIDAAMESERVMAATESVIRATGGAAGMTAGQIADLAAKESMLTGIDDEVVQSGANMLLTFKNIGEDAFPRAQRAMEDMAVAMANGDLSMVDLKGTAIQLGKALNDPEKGMAALARVGVTFNDGQKETVKTMMAMGDVAGAQAVILAELESEFGGMAEAMGETGAGKIEKAKNAIGNLAQEIGEQLLPTIGDLAQGLADLLTRQDREALALKDTEGKARETATSYAEYREALDAQAEAAGMAIDANGNLTEKIKSQGGVVAKVVEENVALSESEWELLGVTDDRRQSIEEASRANETMADTDEDLKKQEQEVKQAMKDLSTFMAGELGRENDNYKEKVDDLRQSFSEVGDKIAELQAQTWPSEDYQDKVTNLTQKQETLREKLQEVNGEIYNVSVSETLTAEERSKKIESLTDKQKRLQAQIADVGREIEKTGQTEEEQKVKRAGAIDELKTKQDEYKAKMDEVATAHELATKRILFDILQEQLAMDGLSQKDSEILAGVASNWGLVDDATAAAWAEMAEYANQANTAGMSVDSLVAKISSLPDEKTITINAETSDFLDQMLTWWANNPDAPEGHALGGDVSGGVPVLVGEQGPEIFVPGQSGGILNAPNTAGVMGGSGLALEIRALREQIANQPRPATAGEMSTAIRDAILMVIG